MSDHNVKMVLVGLLFAAIAAARSKKPWTNWAMALFAVILLAWADPKIDNKHVTPQEATHAAPR